MYCFVLILFIICSVSFFFNKDIFHYLNSFIWSIALVMLFLSGVILSFKFKFLQLNFKSIFKSIFKKSNSKISTFESLSLSLAARIGVGSLSGISLAIFIGGPGTVFWMWVSTILCSINTYVESYLGCLYHKRDNDNYIGGPSYYLKYGLKNNKLAMLYAILIILSYIIGFITIQSNTIIKSISNTFNVNNYFIIVILLLFTIIVIFKGIKRIVKLTSKIVPLMAIIYLILGIYIIISNINIIPLIFKNIFKDAFNFKSIISGGLIIGIQRGIFASEAGIGTSAIASSTGNNPKNEGLSQVFGIYFTTFVICTITALIVLTSNYQSLMLNDINGIEITLNAFRENLGVFGKYLLCIITVLFAYTTIISGYYYGESNLKFLNNNISKKGIFIFKILTVVLIVIGGIISSKVIWNIIDIFIALLAIINVYAIVKLSDNVK